MIKMIEAVLSIIDKIIPSEEKRKAKNTLKEDQELAMAIKEGDMKKVEQIRQRKKRYGSLFGIFICMLMIGCGTIHNSLPIVGDNIPVKLKVGTQYTQESGVIATVESNKNTLVSDAYIYQSVTSLDEPVKKKPE